MLSVLTATLLPAICRSLGAAPRICLRKPKAHPQLAAMSTCAFERLRLQSHARIKRAIAHEQQRLNLIAGRRDRPRTCRYSAHSAFLRCAVNPCGPCETCRDYEPWEA